MTVEERAQQIAQEWAWHERDIPLLAESIVAAITEAVAAERAEVERLRAALDDIALLRAQEHDRAIAEITRLNRVLSILLTIINRRSFMNLPLDDRQLVMADQAARLNLAEYAGEE